MSISINFTHMSNKNQLFLHVVLLKWECSEIILYFRCVSYFLLKLNDYFDMKKRINDMF